MYNTSDNYDNIKMNDNSDKSLIQNYSYGKKRKTLNNNSLNYMNCSYLEESTMSKSKPRESVITIREKEMIETINKLQRNSEDTSEEKLLLKVNNIFKSFLTEIIDLNPHFKVILNKLKISLDQIDKRMNNLETELENMKNANKILNNKIKESEKKHSELEALNKLLSSSNENLKSEIEDLEIRLSETKDKFTQIIETGLSEKVSEELEELFNENQCLKKLSSSLKLDLKKAQIKEKILINSMKAHKIFSKEIEVQLEDVQSGQIEIGRKGVKIPLMDLSILDYSISSDESESNKVSLFTKVHDNFFTKNCKSNK